MLTEKHYLGVTNNLTPVLFGKKIKLMIDFEERACEDKCLVVTEDRVFQLMRSASV